MQTDMAIYTRHQSVLLLPVAVFVFVLALLVGAETANAAVLTYECRAGQICTSANNIWAGAGLNQGSYAPGESVILTVYMASDDAPIGVSPDARGRIYPNSFSADIFPGTYNKNQMTSGISGSVNLGPAPATSGSVVVSYGASGYSSATDTLTLTVLSAPVVNGACAATHYNCSSGTSTNNVDGSTAWTWSCQGSGGGTTASCAEQKLQTYPAISLSQSTATTQSGQAFTLTWSASGVTSCMMCVNINGASCGTVSCYDGSTNGSCQTAPTLEGTYNYKFWCGTPSSGTVGPSKVDHSVVASAPDEPTVSLYWSPSTVPYNGTSNIHWSTSNATYCEHYDPTLNIWVGLRNLPGNEAWFNNEPSGWAYGNRTTNGETWSMYCWNGTTGPVTRRAVLNVTPPAPACSYAGPDGQTVTATSGTYNVRAYGVSSSVTSVYFPTWGDAGGQDDLIWYLGTNEGGGTWRGDINLGSHKSGNPEYGNFNVHAYMNAPGYTNVWCDTANFSRAAPVTGTLTLSPTSCVIADGQSTCSTVYATWTTSNAVAPALVDANTGTTLSTLANRTSPGLQVWVTYPQTVFNLKDGSTVLDTDIATASCATGSSWNSSSGKCVGNAPSGTISASPNPCTVTLGGNTCSTNLTWSTTNVSNPNVYSGYTGTNLSTAASGSNLPATTAISGTTFSVRNSTSVLNSVVVTGQCQSPYAYSGGVCTACGNGGCTGGPGGSPNNPNGGLTCNNGMTPPSCTPPPPTVTLLANPPIIDNGQTSQLTWSSTNATSCTAPGSFSGGSTPGGAVSGSYQTPVLTSTSNYQMSCTGAGGTANSNIATVTVLQPQVTISASPARVHSDETTTISWSASQVNSCSTSGPGLPPTSGLSGTRNIVITAQSTYTITCQTNSSPVTKTILVNLIPSFQEF